MGRTHETGSHEEIAEEITFRSVPKGAGTEQALKNYVLNGRIVPICIRRWMCVMHESDACRARSPAAVADGEEDLAVCVRHSQTCVLKR